MFWNSNAGPPKPKPGLEVGHPVTQTGGDARHSVGFGYAVGDFRDLENGIYFRLNFFEFAGAVESGDPGAQIVVGQRVPLSSRSIIAKRRRKDARLNSRKGEIDG